MTPTQTIDALGAGLANGALTTLVRLYPAIREATQAQRKRACVAMRPKTREVVNHLLDDTKAAPWLAQAQLQLAILTLAQEGIRVLKDEGVGTKNTVTGASK